MDRKPILLAVSILFLTASISADLGSSKNAEPSDYIENSYIIEFEAPSVNEKRGVNAENYRQSLRKDHDKFEARVKKNGVAAVISNSYSTSFNGAAIHNLTDKERRKLQQMPMVKEVHRNYIYQTSLDDSVSQIGADEVWDRKVAGTNITGNGVSIAIIDTGVNYSHPDLGNCTASQFNASNCGKVVSGYDFVDDDWNPMDEQGHGTHVAATAGGNGTLDGVAPRADIMAYRVLDAGGYGSTSDILAGIDQAAQDDADIISLSLGGAGEPDDAFSSAVDNAVEGGSVVTVAAGNDGNFYSVNSPGTARKAITVGAVDNSDQLASYSSKGPVEWNHDMREDIIAKPDLMAPGSDICAAQHASFKDSKTCVDSNHVAISGTSMATPHVAGAAALLLQRNSTMTPLQVKSVLMGSTEDVGYQPFEQGTGRINVTRALDKQIVTYPASLNYSLENSYSGSDTFVVENMGNEASSIQFNTMDVIEFLGTHQSDALSLNSSSMILQPGERETINVTVDATGLNGTYYSYLNLTTNTTDFSHRMPLALKREMPYKPQIESAEPNIRYTNQDPLNASMDVGIFDTNTTAEISWNTTTKTLWQDSSQLTGWTQIDLLPGLNNLTYRVFPTGNNSKDSELKRDIVLDQQDPTMNISANATLVDAPALVNLDIDALDDYSLSRVDVSFNNSGNFTDIVPQVQLDRTDKTCSEQWGANCSTEPGMGEIDNTYNTCPTGDGADEHVRGLELNTTELYINQTVNVTAKYDVYGESDGIYMYHFNGDSWDQLLSTTDRSGGYWETSRQVKIEKKGEHVFRAIIDYTPEGDHCASEGSWFDNDDINLTVKQRGDLDGKDDSASARLNVTDAGDKATWRVNLTDDAGNYDTKSGQILINDAPEITRYKITNGTGAETSLFDQGENVYFNLTIKDNESNLDEAILSTSGVINDTYTLIPVQTSGDNTTYYLNASLGLPDEPGQLNMSFRALDDFSTKDWASKTVTVKDEVGPNYRSINISEEEVLFWRNNTVSVSINDSSGLEKAVIATNVSGTWKNLTDLENTFNSTEGEADFNISGPIGEVYWRIWSSDVYGNWNSSGVKSFEAVNFSVSIPERTELQYGAGITMEKPFWYTVNRSDLGWSYTGKADKVQNGSDIYGLANFTTHNPGRYTVEVFANDTTGKVNSTNRTLTANVSSPASETAFYIKLGRYNLINRTHTGRMIFNAKRYNETSVRMSNSTWNTTLNATVDASEETDYITGEPYNDTYCRSPGCLYDWPSVEFNYTSNRSGDFNITAEVERQLDVINATDDVEFYPGATIRTGVDVRDSRILRTSILGQEGMRLNRTDLSSGNGTAVFKTMPYLPARNRNYGLKFYSESEYDANSGFEIEYGSASFDRYANATTKTVKNTVETGDKRLYRRFIVKPEFGYGIAFATVAHRYDQIDSQAEKNDLTMYQCAEYTLNEGCDSGWSDVEAIDRRMMNEEFEIEAEIEAEAVALGEAYTPETEDEETTEDSGGSSGGSAGGGGFSAPTTTTTTDSNTSTEEEDTVSLEPNVAQKMSFQGKKSVSEIELKSKEKIDVKVDVQDMETESVQPPVDVDRAHSVMNITVDGADEGQVDANITFRLPASETSRPDQVKLYRRSGEWQKLPTRLLSQNSSSYRFTASTPGFSVFMVATERASCPSFQAEKVGEDTCRTFESCEVPEGWQKVDSCETSTDTGSVEERSASTQEEKDSDSGFSFVIAGAVTGTLIVIVTSGFMVARIRRRKELRKEFGEVTDAVKKALRSENNLPENRIKTLIDRAEAAMRSEDYDKMEDVMDELADIIRDSKRRNRSGF